MAAPWRVYCVLICPKATTIYRRRGWRCPPFRVSQPKGCGRPRGQGWRRPRVERPRVGLEAQVGLPTPRVLPPPHWLHLGILVVVYHPTYGLVAITFRPMEHFGAGRPSRWTPRTLPVVPVHYRCRPKQFR
ncbi:hypothetical protein D1007_26665 [Hordeum vulgare]|nr:hypothetical protein D1007_26665 [Hordeum vulgare]